MTEFKVKLAGLNPMAVHAEGVTFKDGFVLFTNTPDDHGTAEILFTVSSDKLEYFGLPDAFEIQARR